MNTNYQNPQFDFFSSNVLLFGYVQAVYSFNLISNLLRKIINFICLDNYIPSICEFLSNYFDDFIGSAFTDIVSELVPLILELVEELGYKVNPKKTQISSCIEALGIEFEILDNDIILSIPNNKKESILEDINDTINNIGNIDCNKIKIW